MHWVSIIRSRGELGIIGRVLLYRNPNKVVLSQGYSPFDCPRRVPNMAVLERLDDDTGQ